MPIQPEIYTERSFAAGSPLNLRFIPKYPLSGLHIHIRCIRLYYQDPVCSVTSQGGWLNVVRRKRDF